MSRLADHSNVHNESDIMWVVCAFGGFCIVIATLFTFTLIVLHLYCIPGADPSSSTEPEIGRKYSVLSAIFAALSVIITFAAYFVCSQWSCWYNDLAVAISMVYWGLYIGAKLFLYLLFLGRLFNPQYRHIYQYHEYTQYVLRALLIVLAMGMIEFTIGNALYLVGIKDFQSLDTIRMAVYVITDSILSITINILFFRPFCCRRIGNSISAEIDRAAVIKYGIISFLQVIASVTYQFSIVVGLYLVLRHVPENTWHSYTYCRDLVQMVDCFLLITCIYCGFARKQTVCLSDEIFCMNSGYSELVTCLSG